MEAYLECSACKEIHEIGTMRYRCQCGGLFKLIKPIKSIEFGKEWSILRYSNMIPVEREILEQITMGEGMTPITKLTDAFENLFVKVDYMMPTLSFKDRGAAVLVAHCYAVGAKKIVQDSSGNAGASVAAYASRMGIPCEIFVPEGTSKKKIDQIAAYGANVIIVEGSREDTQHAAMKAAEMPGIMYGSHVFNPFFYEGTKTYFYEIFEQMDTLPEALIIPVGNGTMLLGVYKAMTELVDAGKLKSYIPIWAVQAETCCPVYEKFYNLKAEKKGETLARAIEIREPLRLTEIVEAIDVTGGKVYLTSESKINETRQWLAELGFYVEPTTAAIYATYIEKMDHSVSAIAPLCGSGLKK